MLLKHADYIQDTQGIEIGLHYLRTKDGAEIDFVISKNNQLTDLIEVKCSNNKPHSTLIHFAEKFHRLMQCNSSIT